jgi:hypothetical protein
MIYKQWFNSLGNASPARTAYANLATQPRKQPRHHKDPTMTLKDYLRCGLLLAVLALAAPAVASNISFMKDTPYAHFTKEDHKLFNEALNNILNSGADGDSRTWSNPTSKAGGELKVLKSFERKGAPCRTLSIANKAKGRSASGEYNFCKRADDQWKLAE